MKINKVRKLTKQQWLNLFVAEYTHDQHHGKWVYASRKTKRYSKDDASEAVIIVPILKQKGKPNKLVVIKEFRVPLGCYTYGFPAGLVDPGESIESTIKREMIEETGFEVSKINKLTKPLHSSMGLTDEAITMAYVDVRANQGAKPESSEDIEVLVLDYNAACKMCDDHDLPIDAKMWVTLYMFKRLGKIE
ncbi:MAG: NUDIX hydrolase [Planctomycetes bacterium]|nr:NUDIX hydrolase [Planctomycetota bacterium]NBY01414.1 NUDIX hydrolase [Planctomycetota bacterium]